MDTQQIFERLKAKFPEQVIELTTALAGEPFVTVAPEAIREVCEWLESEESMEFDYLMCLSGVDYPPDKLGVTYHLISTTKRHKLNLKVFVARDQARVPSVSRVWRTANWHEREAYDLFGIVFTGHPNLRRILLPQDWVGYPLRKDYVFPTEYRGIKCHD